MKTPLPRPMFRQIPWDIVIALQQTCDIEKAFKTPSHSPFKCLQMYIPVGVVHARCRSFLLRGSSRSLASFSFSEKLHRHSRGIARLISVSSDGKFLRQTPGALPIGWITDAPLTFRPSLITRAAFCLLFHLFVAIHDLSQYVLVEHLNGHVSIA